MTFPLARFLAFAARLRIPSKEAGSVPLVLLGTQRYYAMEVGKGLERGAHFFITLKGRQQGFSTISCALDLFWMLDYPAMQGQIINDSDDNHVYFRDIIKEMLGTLPLDYRLPVLVDNDEVLRFGYNEKGHGGSRLLYQVAGQTKKKRARLGRGRGLNYLHGDELGYWEDQSGVDALMSSLAREHPRRLYSLGGTANGDDVLKELWDSAERAISRHRIFIGWWRHEKHVVPQGSDLFAAYGTHERTEDERAWIKLIQRRYDVTITPEQLGWYRYILAEDFRGNEDMRAQEHPCLPEEAFVAFGDKFIRPNTIRRLRADTASDPTPLGLDFVWAPYLDRLRVTERHPKDASLLVWEQPENGGIYVLGAKPADEHSDHAAIAVYRVFPDLMRQVAEYATAGDTTYQFTWALTYLAGAFSPTFDAYVMLDLDGVGMTIQKEMHNLRDAGWGLSPHIRQRQDMRDVFAAIREYVFRRPDAFARLHARRWKTSPEWRPMVMHGLRDCLERGAMQIRSEALIAALGKVRRGDDADPAQRDDPRVSAAALAARHYMDTILQEIESLIPPSTPRPDDPGHVGQFLVQGFMHRALAGRR